MRHCSILLPFALTGTLAGCQGWQSALDTHGDAAGAIADLFWIFLTVCTAVWTGVMIALAIAVTKKPGKPDDPLAVDPQRERRFGRVVAGAVALTLAILLGFTGLSYATQKKLFGPQPEQLTLRVTGHQWWWDVRYENADPSQSFNTANEIHIPVGEPVTIKLESSDVIHSFWVPSLAGKQDAIPGRQNILRINAEKPGIYRGQCAEFCGWQHAHMGLLFIAHTREDFERWHQNELRPALPPEGDRKRGEDALLAAPCVMCHAVRGSLAGGRSGPDLTHLASRQTLAAGTLPMTEANLNAWIRDPQAIKPGVHMPLMQLNEADVPALILYLEGLQ